MSDLDYRAAARRTFDEACVALEEALRLVNDPCGPSGGLPDWATDRLNDILGEHDLMLCDANPDSRPDPYDGD